MFAIDRVVAATGPQLFVGQIVVDSGRSYGVSHNNFSSLRVSEWEAEGAVLPLATIIPTSARWLIYNNLVRAKSVGSIARRTEFGSGILMSILREQRGGGTGHNAWLGDCGASAPDHQQLLAPE